MNLKFIKPIIEIFKGLNVVFKHLFRKPITLEYPEKKKELNNHFRGKLKVNGCVGCGVCKKVCPTGAITYKKDDNGNVYFYKFDLKKCIFCGNCSFYCPKNAIEMTQEYELADTLELVYKGGKE